jgi:thymidylate synthase (FAD)
MSVKLVSVTIPTFESAISNESMTPEEFVVYIARVSNPSNQMNMETAPRLINYLVKHKHWSPFEFVDLTVEIVTRRSIAAQILRHKSFSFQEFSQRYSSATRVQDIELRKQAEKNRQSSAEIFNPDLSETNLSNYKESGNIKAADAVSEFLEASMRLYSELISAGVAREVARDILPLATETTMYMKGSLRSWIHYLELRTLDDTQKEHRDIANQIKHIFIENFPNISEALNFKK